MGRHLTETLRERRKLLVTMTQSPRRMRISEPFGALCERTSGITDAIVGGAA
jgi:hypothetical protein